MNQVVLTIPGPPPPTLNYQERLHWAKRRRLREWWSEQARLAWLAAGRPWFSRPIVQYRLYYPTRRRRDPDNAVAGCKPILDGLRGHAFRDDASDVVTIAPPVIDVDRRRPRTEIVLTETEQEDDT